MKSTAYPRVILHVCPPHHIADELSGSHVPDLHVLTRSSVQSEAVQAWVQLFHLFTQESLKRSAARVHKII